MTDKQESNGFQWTVLTLIGGCIVGAAALQIVNPGNTVSMAPKAVISLSENRIIEESVYPPIDEILNGKAEKRLSVKELNLAFDKLGYKLSPVLEGESAVPRLFLTSLPHDLDSVKQTEKRKSVFFRALLPLVLKINEEITINRAKVMRLRHRVDVGLSLSAEDTIWLDAMFKRYKTKNGRFDRLLTKMDIVPPSLALAQAAEESGWGTSRFVREGNALFGQWTFNPNDKGIVPAGRGEGQSHRIKAFDTIKDSLRAYVLNLNTHAAYVDLRKKRAEMRKNKENFDGYTLAQTLDRYSERGEQYVVSLQAIMDQNNLGQFDSTSLDSGDVKQLPKGPLI